MEFLQTSAGLVTGTALLCTLWLVLQLLGRHGHNLGSKIARTLRHPMLIGLGITLYATWFTHLANRELTLASEKVLNRFSLTLLIGTISWACLNVGHAFISSGQMRRWLQMQDPKDQAMLINLLGRLYTILVLLFSAAGLMVNFGIPSAAIATMLGGAGIGITFATQQVSQNFLSGFMLFFNRPFKEGDWICADSFQGTVEKIGWYYTRVQTFDRRPLFIPNSVFATTPIENPGQMYNRRILANISLRYEDLGRIAGITSDVRQLLEQHPDIDQRQTILVNFNEWDASSINMMVYCFTKTTMWREWLDIQQSIFLEIAAIVQRTGADFAFNCTTLYPAPDANAAELPTLIRRKDQAA